MNTSMDNVRGMTLRDVEAMSWVLEQEAAARERMNLIAEAKDNARKGR